MDLNADNHPHSSLCANLQKKRLHQLHMFLYVKCGLIFTHALCICICSDTEKGNIYVWGCLTPVKKEEKGGR